MKRVLSRVIMAVAVVAMGVTSMDNPAAAQPRKDVTLLLAIGIQLGHIREFVAHGLGFYEEEGLNVSLQPSPGSSQQIQYMLAGQGTGGSIDMHMIVGLRKKEPGKPMVAVYSHLPASVYGIGVLEGGPVQKLEDLKGRTAGVPTRASGTYPFLLAAARLANLSEDDFEIVPVGFGPTASQALISGRIQLISATISGLNMLRYLSNTTDAWKFRRIEVPMDAWPTNAMIFTKDEVENERDKVVGVLRAFAKAHVFVSENPEAALRIVQKQYPELVEERDMERNIQLVKWSMEETYSTPATRAHPLLGWFDPDVWNGTDRYYKEMGLIEQDQSVWDVVDQSLLEAANDFDKEAIRKMAREYN